MTPMASPAVAGKAEASVVASQGGLLPLLRSDLRLTALPAGQWLDRCGGTLLLRPPARENPAPLAGFNKSSRSPPLLTGCWRGGSTAAAPGPGCSFAELAANPSPRSCPGARAVLAQTANSLSPRSGASACHATDALDRCRSGFERKTHA